MEPVTIAIIGSLGLTGLATRRAATRSAQAPLELQVPEIDVVALGGSGSGKTMLLAGMFHELNTRPKDRSYILHTNTAQANELAAVQREIVSPGLDWPRSTVRAAMRDYNFECVAWPKDERTVVANINILEYAGGFLDGTITDARDSQVSARLDDKMRNAKAVFGILDGRMLLNYLHDGSADPTYLRSNIQPVIGQLTNRVPAGHPIYFVITKWDLVVNHGGPGPIDGQTALTRIQNMLFADRSMHNLMCTNPVRFIPVSAVGPNFVKFDPHTGVMAKRRNGTFEPKYVQMPLCAILPDVIDAMEARLNAQQANGGNQPLVGKAATALAGRNGKALRSLFDGLFNTNTDSDLITWLLADLGMPDRRAELERRAEIAHLARTAVLNDFRTAVLRMEAELPGTKLIGGGF